MNQDRLNPDDALADAAAHWCMRVHAEDCTPAEREAFKRWLAADPRHLEEYEAMLEIWQTAELLPRTTTVVDFNPNARQPARARNWRPLASAAAIALLALPLAGWVGWEQGWLPNRYQHVQSTDQMRQVTLSDGSVVELNLHSELRYLNYKDQRQVTLVQGEAFFKVTHDSTHPFIVRAGTGQTRVTGTQFNVWKYEDQVKVTLVEGSVLVSSNGNDGGYRLGPGMQASYRAGDFEPALAQSDDSGNSLAWRSGKLILDNLSLAQALPVINRYLDTPLQLADESTGTIRVSGVYSIHEVKRLVDNLPKVLPIYLTRSKDGSTVLNRISPPPGRG
ncbi:MULTISPECIES: FecR family protein [Pseudomonas]|uniref:Peptide ABC transporter substrate-binding protein n=2 Tax=Pseudomonas TaxID=286 RepID=A0AAX0VRV3_9PSED|nr:MULTISPECIES: FecR family protein [Pseudomonas]MBH3360076.1 FecR family protein [Pseudomonas guariconensis]PLV14079.1 peptide ABC transporter substrate-binding protein [Pseudomonas guariconensis]PLV23522.1 peptide ABC transporter substrate-binding protein [Pseudomonas guariconensis]PLV28545.1 peptide ABC transporter substrate-binding protein [Pseudomonas guariconensis]TYO75669.1 FecR family protein [Pseudomonas sp. CK-NBRI-02]